MNLWILEFKKLFLNKGMFLLMLAALAVNAGKICINGRQDPKILDSRVHWGDSETADAERELSGRITEEKMRFLLECRRQMDAWMGGEADYEKKAEVYARIYPHYAYLYGYHTANEEAVSRAKENIDFYSGVGNSYDAKVNEMFVKAFTGRFVTDYYNSEDFAVLFEYDFSTLLLFLLALIGSSGIFWKERRDGTYELLQTSIYGKKHMVMIKLSAFFVWILLAGILLYGEDVLVHGILYHLEGWGNPAYAIESYQFCPFSGSILEYTLLVWVLRLLAVMEAGAAFALISLLFKGAVFPMLLDIMAFAGCLSLSEQFTEITATSFLNPVTVMKPRSYTISFTAVNVSGIPVSGTAAALGITVFMLFVFMGLIAVCWHFKTGWQVTHLMKRGKGYV